VHPPTRVVALAVACALLGVLALLLVLSLPTAVAVASGVMVAVLLWRMNSRSGGR
jgi:hypothetical protein